MSSFPLIVNQEEYIEKSDIRLQYCILYSVTTGVFMKMGKRSPFKIHNVTSKEHLSDIKRYLFERGVKSDE